MKKNGRRGAEHGFAQAEILQELQLGEPDVDAIDEVDDVADEQKRNHAQRDPAVQDGRG
ncbi:hypothetical protein [Burkholderia cepacia]|uniref:hypothetical protein n=1 Tax=Burkholderia cepacia TaxID=292 RepID=UPI001CF363F9|nr:hypothetical protein [Burkholderia cepacia]MCA8354699.1 hypothetical protein [Burkholderia cepacia]